MNMMNRKVQLEKIEYIDMRVSVFDIVILVSYIYFLLLQLENRVKINAQSSHQTNKPQINGN